MDHNKRFAPNKTVAKLLALEIDKLKFGEMYEQAQAGCTFLKAKLDKANLFLKDPHSYVSDYVTKLKRDIEARKEELKNELDKIGDELVTKLSAFEKECKQNINSSYMRESLKAFSQTNSDTKSKLDEWKKELNVLSIDEVKWAAIQAKAFFLETQLNGRLDEFRDDLQMNKIWFHKKNSKFIREFGKELKSFGRLFILACNFGCGRNWVF